MKRLAKDQDLCIACHVCESECSKTWFKEDNIDKSCIKINQGITLCTQCGECIDVCPIQAITRDANGIVRINKTICVGCFICVGFCPELAMMMNDEYIEPFKCVACGQCAKKCPTKAIYISSENK